MSRVTSPRVWSMILVITIVSALVGPLAVLAQDNDPEETTPTDPAAVTAKKFRAGTGPAGLWLGKVKGPDGKDFEVRLHLDKEGENWFAVLHDPFVGEVRGERVQITNSRVSFTYRPASAPFPSHFSGAYIAGNDRLTGTFSQRGSSVLVKFKRDPDSILRETVDAAGETVEPTRIRHAYKFAATGRFSYWPSLHVVKEEYYNINDLTAASANFDGALKFFVLDGLNIFVRGFRGGLGFGDDAKLEAFSNLGLNADSYLKLDGFEFGLMGYLGNLVARNSKFNPYLTAAVGTVSWELTEGARGTQVVDMDDVAIIDDDMCFAAGAGTEYELGESICLEFEFLWRYFRTEDELKWENPDDVWTNTHAWSLSAGLTWGFW